ncbi:Uma2 family endonuclease [Hymenobacter sp. H14-R3]|uniref:Uma2 family endonuclease n=1 Tax=Hymenobacter sp. H14-R3 TaxID=3046308 RepID=UPI0024BA2071|nr:Uma2 family endonuclease [Hymenobacter sp. H14-R3]MDJ0365321.1 Uma2 family endonuclease [Hymenobacter sp. H14-R3]
MSPQSPISEADYLATERRALVKHEYLAGQLLPMPAVSTAHARLATNAGQLLADQLPDDADGAVLGRGVRLYAPEGPLFTYPDVAVVAGPVQLRPDGHQDTLLNPVLLVKVLPHALPTHFQQVFELYYSIPSVQHVLLVTEYAARVSLGSRNTNGLLSVYGFKELKDTILLPDLGLKIALAELYEGVSLGG